MNTNQIKTKSSNIIKTDLFSLIDAVADEISEGEEHLIPEAVLGILNHNKIRFINKNISKINN